MKIKIFILFLLSLYCVGCGGKKTEERIDRVPRQSMPKKLLSAPVKAEEPPYKYLGLKFKDPFIPLIGGAKFSRISQEETGEIDPASLSLKGILIDSQDKMATLVDTFGNSYIIKNKRLYNRKGELIEGIVGIVKLETVVIITKDKTVRELKLKSEEEY